MRYKKELMYSTILIVFLLLKFSAYTQTEITYISPEVTATSGGHFSGNNLEMSWTLGQPVITTIANDSLILTQGFHQSEDIYLDVIRNPQQQIVITPNEDGLNDSFVLESLDNFSENEITIINRWGGVVFQAKPYLNDWKGQNSNGRPLPEGTYYFMAKLNLNAHEYLIGSITIKR